MAHIRYTPTMDSSRGQNTPFHSSPKNDSYPTPPWPTPPPILNYTYSETPPNHERLYRMNSFCPGIYIFSLSLFFILYLPCFFSILSQHGS